MVSSDACYIYSRQIYIIYYRMLSLVNNTHRCFHLMLSTVDSIHEWFASYALSTVDSIRRSRWFHLMLSTVDSIRRWFHVMLSTVDSTRRCFHLMLSTVDSTRRCFHLMLDSIHEWFVSYSLSTVDSIRISRWFHLVHAIYSRQHTCSSIIVL